MQELRLLLISHGLPPESVGGVEQHVDGLARALLARGVHVQVYSKTAGLAEQPQGMVVVDNSQPYPVHRVVYRYEGLDSLASLYAQPILDRSFADYLSSQRFDIAHVHHLTGLSTGILDVLNAAGLPCLLTLHDYWMICPRGQMWHRDESACQQVEAERCRDCLQPGLGAMVDGAKDLRSLHRSACRALAKPRRLILPSARALPPFTTLGIAKERFFVVENGVDTEALQNLPPPELDDDRPIRIGYLGTLIPSKGLHVLTRAFASLPRGTAELHIHGNRVPYHGDEGYAERTLAGLGSAQGVFEHGPYETPALPKILSKVDLIVAPALWHEAYGLTVREALAASRPALVSNIGGLTDSVTDGVDGRTLPPGDSHALATALAELCNDRDGLSKLIQGAARRRVRGHDEMAAEMLRHYREVLALAPPGS